MFDIWGTGVSNSGLPVEEAGGLESNHISLLSFSFLLLIFSILYYLEVVSFTTHHSLFGLFGHETTFKLLLVDNPV